MFKSYKLFWTRAFEREGESSLKEYCWPVFINAIVTIILFWFSVVTNKIVAPLYLAYENADGGTAQDIIKEISHINFTDPGILLARYLGIAWALLTLIPFVTVMARRLRKRKHNSSLAIPCGVFIVIYQLFQMFPTVVVESNVIPLNELGRLLFDISMFIYFIIVAIVFCMLPDPLIIE